MITIREKNFNIREIAISGQCFRMKQMDGYFEVVAKDKCIKISQKGQEITFHCTKKDFENFWKHYFDLETNYGKIIRSIDPKDDYLKAAASSCKGIRILNQDPWEMIITFIISQQNNIPRIKKIVEALCEKYGEEIQGRNQYAFPTSQALATATEKDLLALGLGYRAKYILKTARDIACGDFDLLSLCEDDYETARKKLLTLYGVGPKVADCICLFGLHHVEAFPIDTHIKQVFAKHYPKGFPFERYEGYAGILQQYMFYYDLNK